MKQQTLMFICTNIQSDCITEREECEAERSHVCKAIIKSETPLNHIMKVFKVGFAWISPPN